MRKFAVRTNIVADMQKKATLYASPRCECCAADWEIVLCDSYNSGIEDFDYEEIDWTVKP